MNLKTVMINGEEVPYKLTNRAKSRFEKKYKVLIADIKGSHDMLHKLVLEAIVEGFLLTKQSKTITLNQLEEADAMADESIIDEIIKSFDKNEGKQEASTNEA